MNISLKTKYRTSLKPEDNLKLILIEAGYTPEFLEEANNACDKNDKKPRYTIGECRLLDESEQQRVPNVNGTDFKYTHYLDMYFPDKMRKRINNIKDLDVISVDELEIDGTGRKGFIVRHYYNKLDIVSGLGNNETNPYYVIEDNTFKDDEEDDDDDIVDELNSTDYAIDTDTKYYRDVKKGITQFLEKNNLIGWDITEGGKEYSSDRELLETLDDYKILPLYQVKIRREEINYKDSFAAARLKPTTNNLFSDFALDSNFYVRTAIDLSFQDNPKFIQLNFLKDINEDVVRLDNRTFEDKNISHVGFNNVSDFSSKTELSFSKKNLKRVFTIKGVGPNSIKDGELFNTGLYETLYETYKDGKRSNWVRELYPVGRKSDGFDDGFMVLRTEKEYSRFFNERVINTLKERYGYLPKILRYTTRSDINWKDKLNTKVVGKGQIFVIVRELEEYGKELIDHIRESEDDVWKFGLNDKPTLEIKDVLVVGFEGRQKVLRITSDEVSTKEKAIELRDKFISQAFDSQRGFINWADTNFQNGYQDINEDGDYYRINCHNDFLSSRESGEHLVQTFIGSKHDQKFVVGKLIIQVVYNKVNFIDKAIDEEEDRENEGSIPDSQEKSESDSDENGEQEDNGSTDQGNQDDES